ncbi:hypothetical protein [Planococcus lenghuensis]|uniref:ZIP Zinc transporter n=1 Tax=Planococcus lenghuensis TaxID=2213202 RepID=A0A1Q2L244_9BACL|nr:hypothetical protein [Planococcus lenghuensis]AQQ54528.1 hypothetical protein B0X71_16405 [Planococcus lenghuensis]
MTTTNWISLLFIIGLIILHFSEKYLNLSTKDPRSKLLSFAGGATIAYSFIFLIPELAHYNDVLKRLIGSESWLAFFEEYTYTLAFLGLLIYYGLDLLMSARKKKTGDTGNGLFAVHIAAFFFYNFFIGYLLVIQDFKSYWAMIVFFIALGLHFIASDHSLKAIHEEDYDKYGRWFLVAAIFAGWLTAVLFNPSEAFAAVGISFLAGGLLFNTFKDDVREGSSHNYWAFAGGAVLIAFLYMLTH